MGGKCDYNNSVEKFEQDSQSGPAPDRRINTMANCAIVGINWGDEGKGRMVDYLTDHYDVVVRYQGGGNAGHTVVNEKGKFALHLLPSGIFRDGVVNILGNGVALDCENLLKEMETLRAAGVIITPENLKVSDRASLLLPWHRELDALEEARLADKKYGSTKQGIAPFYGDKYQKKTVQAGELLHPEHLKEHLADLLEWKNLMLQKIYGAKGYTMDELMAWVNTYCGAIKPYITDTGRFLRNAQKEGKSILFEAQLGALRDLDYGIYPYTTSSNAVAAYAPVGSGLPTAKLDEVVGVVKAYSSCVGEGPFVCEWFGPEAEKLRDIPHSISVFEICGPMFFAAADQILNINSNHHTKVVVIRMRSVPAIDASAMRSLHELANRAKRKNITLVFSHVNEQPMRVMEKDGFIGLVGKENFHHNIVDALDYAEALVK